jgi:hypothetical protein
MRDQRADRRAPAIPLGRPGGHRADSGRDEISAPPTATATWSCSSKAPASAGPEAILDDPQWVEWRGGLAHEFSAA